MAPQASLGHVHLTVRDLERAVEFYTGYFGLEVTERLGQFAFLSWGDQHHDIALQAAGTDAPMPEPGVGLYHVAIEVDDASTFRSLYQKLQADGISVSAVDHSISKALYFSDPDGIGLEVVLDTRSTDHQHWAGASRPFDPLTDLDADCDDSVDERTLEFSGDTATEPPQ